VSYFVEHYSFSNVAVLSRSATGSKNRVEGATYHAGDLTRHSEIQKLLDDLKPMVIIHAASPSPLTGTPREYERVNIKGTQNLLKVAKDSKYVRVFIYTSSSTLARGPEHLNLDETCPLANTDSKASYYAKSKADAEDMILHANQPKSIEGGSWVGSLVTAALRFPIVYGIRDTTTIPGCLNALATGHTTTTLGDGKNLWDFCSTENTAISHILLASALLDGPQEPTAKVDGEAFNINDGEPYPLWGFARLCWKYAGYDPQPFPKITSLPSWFALGLANTLEWVYWVFRLGTKRPYNLGKQQVEYSCFTHTYSIKKAKTRLGFKPKIDFEGDLKRAVQWCLKEGGWRERLKGVEGVKIGRA
jgi:sterol-4alpha-carboxylate 3-dehydrogenase (decarboxylating)